MGTCRCGQVVGGCGLWIGVRCDDGHRHLHQLAPPEPARITHIPITHIPIGLVSAGLAFALQQVITSLAAYFVILRGDTFGVADRITLGGVRGDVVRLGFLKTTIMEMGQPPSVRVGDPLSWVQSRQYTGRLVTVTNGVIFTEPVYNYSREFPYLWEEIVLPVAYTDDRAAAEDALLTAARTHALVGDAKAARAWAALRSRYAVAPASMEPDCVLADHRQLAGALRPVPRPGPRCA